MGMHCPLKLTLAGATHAPERDPHAPILIKGGFRRGATQGIANNYYIIIVVLLSVVDLHTLQRISVQV